jgi:hypothetical protein
VSIGGFYAEYKDQVLNLKTSSKGVAFRESVGDRSSPKKVVVSDLKWGPITCRIVQTRSVWKVNRVYSVTATVTQRDSHTDNQPQAWCRDEGSGELKASDSSVSTH